MQFIYTPFKLNYTILSFVLYQPIHNNSVYSYMFRLTIVAINSESFSTDPRGVQHILPFTVIPYAAHVCTKWPPRDGYDG
jgi:hypothetical protein